MTAAIIIIEFVIIMYLLNRNRQLKENYLDLLRGKKLK